MSPPNPLSKPAAPTRYEIIRSELTSASLPPEPLRTSLDVPAPTDLQRSQRSRKPSTRKRLADESEQESQKRRRAPASTRHSSQPPSRSVLPTKPRRSYTKSPEQPGSNNNKENGAPGHQASHSITSRPASSPCPEAGSPGLAHEGEPGTQTQREGELDRLASAFGENIRRLLPSQVNLLVRALNCPTPSDYSSQVAPQERQTITQLSTETQLDGGDHPVHENAAHFNAPPAPPEKSHPGSSKRPYLVPASDESGSESDSDSDLDSDSLWPSRSAPAALTRPSPPTSALHPTNVPPCYSNNKPDSESDTDTVNSSEDDYLRRNDTTKAHSRRPAAPTALSPNSGALPPPSKNSHHTAAPSRAPWPSTPSQPNLLLPGASGARSPAPAINGSEQAQAGPLTVDPLVIPPPPAEQTPAALLRWALQIIEASTGIQTSVEHQRICLPTNSIYNPNFGRAPHSRFSRTMEEIHARQPIRHANAAGTRQVVNSSSHYDNPYLIEDNAEELEEAAARAMGKHFRIRKKSKLADFPGIRRHVASAAIPQMLARALTEGPYESKGTYTQWAGEEYIEVYLVQVTDANMLPPEPAPLELEKIIARRVSWKCGECVVKLRPLIPMVFGLITLPSRRRDLKANKRLAEILLPTNFHCLNWKLDTGQFEHDAVTQCIVAVFFWGEQSPGAMFPEKFGPALPYPALAFVLTIMQFCIEEWSPGRWKRRSLSADEQLEVYESYLRSIIVYEGEAPGCLRRFCKEWFQTGVNAIGLTVKSGTSCQPVISASHVRPDTPPPGQDG